MGRNDFKNSVLDSLNELLSDPEIGSGTGAIQFTRQDKKTQGKLYLKQGKAYAINITNYETGLLRRILTSGLVNEEHSNQILSKFATDQENPLVVDYVLTYQMMPEQPLTGFIKDYFLGAFDELSSWTNVNVSWKANEDTEDFNVPFVEPSKLLTLAANRKAYLEGIANSFTLEESKINDLKFKFIGTTAGENIIEKNLISSGAGEFTVSDAARQFGLSPFIVKQALFGLWSKQEVEMIYDNEFPIRYLPPQEDPIDEVETSEVVEEGIAEVASPAGRSSLLEPQVKQERLIPDSIASFIVNESLPIETEVSPSVVSNNEDEETILLEELEEEKSVPQEIQIEDSIEIEDPEETAVPIATEVAVAPVETTTMITSGIPNLVQQLSAEISSLKSTINESQERINTYEEEIKAAEELIAEKTHFIEITKAAQLTEENKLEQSTQQYQEIVSFIKKIG